MYNLIGGKQTESKNMKNINICFENICYDINIGSGILENTGRIIKERFGYKNAVIITDKNVAPFYLNIIEKSLTEEGITSVAIVIKPSEKSKSISTVEKICSLLSKHNIKRNDFVIALGGGVVGDIAGFVSSVWLRGVDYIQIPTTLLSQVDSSIGGKTAVNTKYGKNLVGSFHNPKHVFIDTNTLKTLSKREFFSGVAEMIKHASIADENMFSFFENNYTYESIINDIENLIERNINIKKYIVEKDPYEKNERMKLNFGHTFAHAIENAHEYKNYLHGEAVVIGMLMACEVGERHGITEKSISLRLKNLIKKMNFISEYKNKDILTPILRLDKKSCENGINFVFLKKIGEALIQKIKLY